jgi:hypothetical protein
MVRYNHPDEAVKLADVRQVTREVMGVEPWLSGEIECVVVSGGITNLLFRMNCGGEVRSGVAMAL